MEYIKINTLWKRDETTHKIIEGDYSKEEFNNIKLWDVSEKINGTNIRITYDRIGKVQFDGKTDNAQIPAKLYAYLQSKFNIEFMKTIFPLITIEETKDLKIKSQESQIIILFGEGVGAGIKGSGNYFKDKGIGFILFDVYIDGWWLERENVIDIANKLGIKYAPELGIMDIQSAIDLVKTPRNSNISELSMIAEGIVARSHPLMLFRDGKPIMWKLKVVDYNNKSSKNESNKIMDMKLLCEIKLKRCSHCHDIMLPLDFDVNIEMPEEIKHEFITLYGGIPRKIESVYGDENGIMCKKCLTDWQNAR